AEDRGHLLLSGEHYDNAGVTDFTEREWAGDGYAVVRTPAPLPQSSTASPTRALLRDVRNSDRNTAGLITNGPLSGNYFNPDGTVSPFPYGTYRTSAHMSGGGTNDDI